MSLSFKTNQLKSRKKVEIDGHIYFVRRYGNIEIMEVDRLQREMDAILKAHPTDVKDDDLSPEEQKILMENSSAIFEMLVGLFDDGEDGSKSRKLVKSLNEADLADMFNTIFKDEADGGAKK